MRKMNVFQSAECLGFGRRAVLYIVAALVAVALLTLPAYAAMMNIIASGTIPLSAIFEGPAMLTARTLTIAPGETLAWHYHPGYAFNAVKSGTLTFEEGCGGSESFSANQAFEELDGHVHRAMNLGATDAIVSNTFIVPQGRPTTVNIPNNERRCGPPAEVNECKDGGWAKFDFPAPFENEGDCVQFVRHRPRVTLSVPLDPLQ
jgi:quercetin dioxygenase-like cupin family protein